MTTMNYQTDTSLITAGSVATDALLQYLSLENAERVADSLEHHEHASWAPEVQDAAAKLIREYTNSARLNLDDPFVGSSL